MPWVESTTNEELKSHFESWGQDPMIILDHLKNPSKWYIHALEPLESYVRDKVVLGMPSVSPIQTLYLIPLKLGIVPIVCFLTLVCLPARCEAVTHSGIYRRRCRPRL